jgi:uncharacterized LabA/DUF88 family protein
VRRQDPLRGRDLIAYIDGFNLYHGIHEASGRALLWLDLVELVRRLRPRSRLVRVKYFTAAVMDDPDALSRQEHYVKALTAQHPELVSVHWGRYQRKDARCRRCGLITPRYEEKETDVSIAVSLLADAWSGALQDALLVTADSDLAPAVQLIRERAPDAFVAAAFPPRRSSAHLKSLMPSSMPIYLSRITASQLPDQVVDRAAGRVYERPDKWRRG